MKETILSDIKDRLHKKNIYELRQIARAVGVARPADGKKERLMEDIVKIATCEIAPAPRTARGAPPKSAEYDKSVVADVEECIKYYSAAKDGTKIVPDAVCDGGEETECAGLLFCGERKNFLRVAGCSAGEDDVYVNANFISRFGLREGDMLEGICRRNGDGEASGLVSVSKINGYSPDVLTRKDFSSLTAVFPENRIRTARSDMEMAKAIDLFAPIGYGQRALVYIPANAGKNAFIKQIAAGICLNQRGLKVVIMLSGAAPEEVTDFKRSVTGAELYCTTFLQDEKVRAESARLILNYCKRQTECGYDVVLIASGLTSSENGGMAESAGAGTILSCARNAEEGGSLTVIGVLSDAALCAKLKDMCNMYAEFSAEYAAAGIYPPVDAGKCYTLESERIQTEDERRATSNLKKLNALHGAAETAKIICGGDYGEIIKRYK